MPIHHTYCDFHLGDNLNHLNFLRALAQRNPGHLFIHSAHECHLPQMREVVEDVKEIDLTPLTDRSPSALNAWKNAGEFFGRHPGRDQYYEFHLDWYRHHAAQMGLESPFEKIEDMLFDYPALLKFPPFPEEDLRHAVRSEAPSAACHPSEWDFLVINSRPCSGQLLAYDSVDYFDPLLRDLAAKGYSLLVTQPTGVRPTLCTMDLKWSVSQIGAASRHCKHHIMVSTGPSWPALNKWNYPSDNLRMLFLATERLNLPGLVHVPDLNACREVLVERGLL